VDNKDMTQLLAILLGVGVVGSVLGILWYRMTADGPLEKDTIFFIIKLFMGISIISIAIALFYQYA
jgi:hypothetical protein